MEGKEKVFTVNRLLSLLFIVMLLPFMMVSIWSFDYIRKDNIEMFEDNLTRFTHNTAMESVNRQLEEIEMVFQILNSRMTSKSIHEYIQNERDALNSTLASLVNTLTFFDAAIMSDNNDDYRIYPNVKIDNFEPSKQVWYPGVKQKNGIHYSEPYLDIIPNSKMAINQTITASMDLFDEKLLKYGNVAFDLDLYSMSAPLQDVVAPFKGKFLVAAKDGSVVMHANYREIFHQTVPLRWIENANDLEGNFYDEELQKFIYYRSFSDPFWVAFTIVDKAMYDEFISKAPQTLTCIVSICLIIYIILICLCRVYIRGIINRLYLSVTDITYDGEPRDLERIYKNIKHSHAVLKEARRISDEDALTGIGTRRKFDEKVSELVQSNTPFYLAILDLDNFKKINDTYGHAVGDSVLKYVSNVGKSIVQPDYDVYRFGGEELVVLFPGGDYTSYLNLMDVWRQTISQRQWREVDLTVSFSCGIARWKQGETVQAVIAKADKALYEAKNNGKNKICSSRD